MTYSVVKIGREDALDVFNFMRKYFNGHEPMNVALNRQPNSSLDNTWYIPLLEYNLSYKVVDNTNSGEICGVVLNEEFQIPENFPGKERSGENGARTIFQFLTMSRIQFYPKLKELMKQKQIDKTFEICMITVKTEYRQQSIARLMVEKSLEEAKNLQHKLAIIECTGAYSARLAEKVGFKCIHELAYNDFTDPNGDAIIQTAKPHQSFKSFVKEL